MRLVSNAVACARLRLTLAMRWARTDPDTGTLGWAGGRSSDGFGMTGVCPWQYWRCSPHLAQRRRSLLVAESQEGARLIRSVADGAPRVTSDLSVAPGSRPMLA
jgi:hypothetical protein